MWEVRSVRRLGAAVPERRRPEDTPTFEAALKVHLIYFEQLCTSIPNCRDVSHSENDSLPVQRAPPARSLGTTQNIGNEVRNAQPRAAPLRRQAEDALRRSSWNQNPKIL
jgi:hypothetical protein